MLPINEKVKREDSSPIKIWVYGEPNIGKTTFANQFPNVLMLNTDGNIRYVDAPAIQITQQGNLTPWEVFTNSIDDILKGEHTYETIVVDLIEDTYQFCRAYYSSKLKIDHESDMGFGKGYDIVRNNFINALRKLTNSKYNVVLISHEFDKEYKTRTGLTTTKFLPNITEKLIPKVAGIVDITGRILMDVKEMNGIVKEDRILYLTSTADQYGGNKVKGLVKESISLKYEELLKAYRGESK